MRKLSILLLLCIVSVTLFAATIEISKPVRVTNDNYFDRGNDITYGNGYYWLFYGKAINNPGANYWTTPDADVIPYPQITYKKAASIEGLVNAPEEIFPYVSDDIYNGEVWCEFFDYKIFVAFYDETTTADPGLQLWYTVNGTSWNFVGRLDAARTGHADMEVYNGELWVIVNTGEAWHSPTPTNIASWESSGLSGVTGTKRVFNDDGILYGIKGVNTSSGTIYKYDADETPPWFAAYTVGVSAYDPVFSKLPDDDYLVLSAPWDGSCQAYLYSTNSELSNLTGADFKVFEAATYPLSGGGTKTWVAMWGQAIRDIHGPTPTGKTYVFYCSERNEANPESPIAAEIYYIAMDWSDLSNHHFTFINSAFSGVTVGAGGSQYSYNGVVVDDVIEVYEGVYNENVIIDIDVTIDGNSVAEIVALDNNQPAIHITDSATINYFKINGGLTQVDSGGRGLVDATYNYWGEDGPTTDEISGNVSYVPWYADEAMTILASPYPDVTVDGDVGTISWTEYPGATYTVYGSDDPTDITNLVTVVNGEVPTIGAGYKYYAVKVTVGGTDYMGYGGYTEFTFYEGYNYFSVCLDYGFSDVLGFASEYGYDNIETGKFTVSKWDAGSQGWISVAYGVGSFDGNFDINVGDVINVNDTRTFIPRTLLLSGQLPDAWATFNLITTETTDINLIYLPLNQTSLNTVALVGNNMGIANANTISMWDAENQQWITSVYFSAWGWINSTEISTGRAMMVGALQEFSWPIR